MAYYGISCAYLGKFRKVCPALEKAFMEEILTASEVAALLKVHLRTVYNLARRGLIPAMKLGGSWRFSKSAILNMVPGGEFAVPMERHGHPEKGD